MILSSQRRFIRPASFLGVSFLLVRRGGIRKSLIDQHAANLGGRAQESNRNAKPISGLAHDHRLDGPCTIW